MISRRTRGARVRRARGTTRTVWLVGRWAVKVPSVRRVHPHRLTRTHAFARGWCANLSEWRYRDRSGVCSPRWTVLGVLQVYPRAAAVEAPDDAGGQPPVWCYPAPAELEVDRTWHNLGLVGREPGTAVWVDFDQTDRNR